MEKITDILKLTVSRFLSRNKTKCLQPLIMAIGLFLFNYTPLLAQNGAQKDLSAKLKELKQHPNFEKDTLYIDLLFDIGREICYYDQDSLLKLSKETIKLSQAIDYKKGEAKGLINLGSYFSDTGKQEEAITHFKEALSISESIGDYDILLRAKNFLAIEYEYDDQYAKAIKQYLDGIEIAKQHQLDTWLSTFYVNTSNHYHDQKEYEQAIHFLTKAKELNVKAGNDKVTAVTMANLVSAYIELGDLKKASENIGESIRLLEELGLREWLTYAYELKANIYLKKEQYGSALSWFKKSEKIHDSIAQIRYKIPLFNDMAKTYLGLRDYEKSETYALRALEFAKELNNIEGKAKSIKILYDIKKETEDPIQALAYLEAYKRVEDTINKRKNEKELRILKSKLEFDQEKERYLVESEKKVTQQKAYFYSALFIILTFGIIIFILRRNNKIQDQLNQRLKTQKRELQRKEKDLRASNNTKSRLFSIIAHDLRGPINSFKTLFDLIGTGEIGKDEFMGFMPKIRDDINSIAFTLNNLLSWGQTQMNGMVTRHQMTNLRALVNENVHLLSDISEQKSITLYNEVDQSIRAWCDTNQIDIVIRNLMSNAIKFTPKHGSVTIGANEKEDFWEIYVKDTGIGMSQEALSKIFDAQETFSTFGTNQEKGTGIGLVLCKEMVEKNDGTVWVESTLNEGSCFYFSIPKVGLA
ncbi:tetratricopeptide repeat protein [Maribacter thermophilus]|uniref:tetratricopeptide repeat protein n=1 Tax=Maribacter thermophilus TaxID=1197874 RepID=UPI000A63C8A3|nr:tetratricopeptide repeat protein [Maribacter thermophilus]